MVSYLWLCCYCIICLLKVLYFWKLPFVSVFISHHPLHLWRLSSNITHFMKCFLVFSWLWSFHSLYFYNDSVLFSYHWPYSLLGSTGPNSLICSCEVQKSSHWLLVDMGRGRDPKGARKLGWLWWFYSVKLC